MRVGEAEIYNAASSFKQFEIQKYYKNEPKFNGFYSINTLSKIKNGAYIMNLGEYESVETHYIILYINAKNVTTLIILELNVFRKK